MDSMYFYRHEIIQRTSCGKGWYFYTEKIEHDIYKTIIDAKNAIDKRDGNIYSPKTHIEPKRHERPINIIGKMIFVLDNISDTGKVESHYEYEWF
jgi:hypothetical protein